MRQESEKHTPAEVVREPVRTRLSMIIDPAEQTSDEAVKRTRNFLEAGGDALFVGGSGYIDGELFEETVGKVVSEVNDSVPLFVLPGDLRQIPKDNRGIAGVFNYSNIYGTGNTFDNVYPPAARDFVFKTLRDRMIPSISTLYVLCGDPNASVSRETGIKPLDLSSEDVRDGFFDDIESRLNKYKTDCVFFEAGSRSDSHIDRETIMMVRHMIDDLSMGTRIIVSGGIKSPEQASLFRGIADYVNIGSHFERNGAVDASDFVSAIRI